MANTTTPTTPKDMLGAINELLRAIRRSNIMGLLDTDQNEDSSAAKQALDTASIEVQTKGWYFNTEEDFVIDPEAGTGQIMLPSNTLKVRSIRCERGDRLVERGPRLYNPKKHTYNIGEAVKVDIVLALPFEELPETARAYVTALAARRFCIPRLPTGATFNYTAEVLQTALVEMEHMDTEHRDRELAETSPHFANMARR